MDGDEMTVRRRTGLDRTARVLAAARADPRGIRLPGAVAGVIRWRSRIDVVLVADELRIAGHGGIWRYPVHDMVLVSGAPGGTLRVDFLLGGPLVVSLDDEGELLGRLRRAVEAHGRASGSGRRVALLEVGRRRVAVVPSGSDDAVTAAIALLLGTPPGPDASQSAGVATHHRLRASATLEDRRSRRRANS